MTGSILPIGQSELLPWLQRQCLKNLNIYYKNCNINEYVRFDAVSWKIGIFLNNCLIKISSKSFRFHFVNFQLFTDSPVKFGIFIAESRNVTQRKSWKRRKILSPILVKITDLNNVFTAAPSRAITSCIGTKTFQYKIPFRNNLEFASYIFTWGAKMC